LKTGLSLDFKIITPEKIKNQEKTIGFSSPAAKRSIFSLNKPVPKKYLPSPFYFLNKSRKIKSKQRTFLMVGSQKKGAGATK
jgi:hypothetical protein